MSKKIWLVIWLIIIVAIVWFLRPFFHPLIMSFIITPLNAILDIVIIVGVWGLIRSLTKLRFEKVGPANFALRTKTGFSSKLVATFSIVIVILGILIGLQGEIRYWRASQTTDFTTRQDLPNFEPLRLTPKQVATRYADDTFQSPQEKLGDSQIVSVDGKLERVFPRIPDGGILYFINKMSGFVTVDVSTLDRKVSIVDAQFQYSDGIGVFDNLYYRLSLKKFFVTYSAEPIYLKDDAGSWVTMVPYMKYKGFPFTVPYWAGVMEVKQDGLMIDYTPEEAAALSWAKNNRLYPKELAEYYAQAYAYKGGLINKWFLHKDQTQVVSLPGEEPILHVATNEGFKQMIVAEPSGQSFGIYKIFLFDATTGKREVINYDLKSQLTGPIAAADYIKRDFPSYDWNTFMLAEPRPVKINGDLNWMLSIIPSDAAGIAKTVLLDAKTNKVTSVDTEAQLAQLVNTGAVSATPTPSPTSSSGAVDKAAIQAQINSIQTQLDQLKALVK